MTAKRLELLREVVPTLREAAILLNSANPSNKAVLKEAGSAAKALKIGLQAFYVRRSQEFEDAFAAMVNAHIGAFVTNEDPVFVASVESSRNWLRDKRYRGQWAETSPRRAA